MFYQHGIACTHPLTVERTSVSHIAFLCCDTCHTFERVNPNAGRPELPFQRGSEWELLQRATL